MSRTPFTIHATPSPQISSMDGWSLVGINVTKTVNLEPLTTVPEKVAADSIGVDLLVTSLPDKIIYFSAPQDYLGNKLVSYGGHLNYSIYYNTGAFGKYTSQPIT